MQITLDACRMRAAMDLWRQELGAEPSVDALARLGATLGGWLDLLRLCTPGPGEADELLALAAEVEQLRQWAQEASAALLLMRHLQAR